MSAEQHHYVPQFLLKNFTRGKKPKVFVYDKHTGKSFRTNIKNVATENGFYDLEFKDRVLTLEPGLAHLEANTSRIIRKLLREKNVKLLNQDEVAILATFLAVQFVRTKEFRLRFEHLGELLAQKLGDMGASEKSIEESIRGPANIPQDKLFGFRFLLRVTDFVPHFLNKVWLLYETANACPFYISDNPIGLHNERDYRPYGNLGLAVPGIEIYFPISSTLCLSLLCPTIAEEFQRAHNKVRMLDQMAPDLADTTMARPAVARAFFEGLSEGTAIKIIEDNVTMINSLQVVYSSRFVYCENDAFELVERMIRDDPNCRQGLRLTIN